MGCGRNGDIGRCGGLGAVLGSWGLADGAGDSIGLGARCDATVSLSGGGLTQMMAVSCARSACANVKGARRPLNDPRLLARAGGLFVFDVGPNASRCGSAQSRDRQGGVPAYPGPRDERMQDPTRPAREGRFEVA